MGYIPNPNAEITGGEVLKIINYEATIRKNNIGLNDPGEFYKLDPETQGKLLDWISINLTKRKGFNYRYSSYRLKHLLPFYVTNGAFKGAMIRAGFRVADKAQLNWNFNVYIRKGRNNENSRPRAKS